MVLAKYWMVYTEDTVFRKVIHISCITFSMIFKTVGKGDIDVML